jgi:hypothetical protein
MRKCLLFEFIKSYCNEPVDEFKDPIGDSSGDEMHNSDTKICIRINYSVLQPYILVSKILAVSDQISVNAVNCKQVHLLYLMLDFLHKLHFFFHDENSLQICFLLHSLI